MFYGLKVIVWLLVNSYWSFVIGYLLNDDLVNIIENSLVYPNIE